MSKHFTFNPLSVERMVRMAGRVGLDGVALTEHFHAVGFWPVHEHLAHTYPNEGGVFWADGLALIPGADINIREGAHVHVLGDQRAPPPRPRVSRAVVASLRADVSRVPRRERVFRRRANRRAHVPSHEGAGEISYRRSQAPARARGER